MFMIQIIIKHKKNCLYYIIFITYNVHLAYLTKSKPNYSILTTPAAECPSVFSVVKEMLNIYQTSPLF